MKTAGVRGSHRRGRSRSGAYYLCAGAAATLLLISVTVLYSRLSITSTDFRPPPSLSDDLDDDNTDLLRAAEDRIDELDDESDAALEDDDDAQDYHPTSDNTHSRSGYFYDHLTGAIRRRFRRRSIDDWDEIDGDGDNFGLFERGREDLSKGVIGSDDVPVDEAVRRKAVEVVGIEDALMVKIAGARVSPLREGWGDWFDKKSDFLRRDKMFKTSFEVLNPLNNAMVQDPDGVGVTGLTRGDRLMQKLLLSEIKKVPFLMKKTLGSVAVSDVVEVKRKDSESNVVRRKSEAESHVYADGKRWGYYPGLRSDLSFTDFVDGFFGSGKCGLRVFMVWNSPPWMFSVRYQRGIESVFHHHRDACVLVLSETIELDFFKDSFVKDGYKVAVAMPNLDELLKDTPAHVFTSAWFEWRKTKYYATHYSELVRLAALYKHGGIYLDSDIIVLRPLSSLHNSVGIEDQIKGSPLNGAVMAFRKHSPFVMDCIKEFYMTYDDTRLKWNGAELLTRVATKFLKTKRKSLRELELKLQPSSALYPITSRYITKYFISPTTDSEKVNHNALFDKIRNESFTFHFWNSITSSLIPEPDSLVARLIDHTCIRCSDVL